MEGKKKKNHVTISIGTFDTVQHPFMTNTLKRLGLEGTYAIIRPYMTAYIIPNGEKLKAYP